MFKAAVAFITFALIYLSMIDEVMSMNSMNLNEFQWRNRLLLIFAPDRKHPMFENLHKSITSQQAAVVDRDLVVFEILEAGSSFMGPDHIDTAQADFLRKKFGALPGKYTIILIGKDGGIKLNTEDRDTKLGDIFALIDSMPMRQSEIRRKQ
jgi:hypothetical protein